MPPPSSPPCGPAAAAVAQRLNPWGRELEWGARPTSAHVLEQHEQAWQRAGIDSELRLDLVARHDVADGAQRGHLREREGGEGRGGPEVGAATQQLDGRKACPPSHLHRALRVDEQLDDALRDARLEARLHAHVVAVGHVREGPQRVDEDLQWGGERETETETERWRWGAHRPSVLPFLPARTSLSPE